MTETQIKNMEKKQRKLFNLAKAQDYLHKSESAKADWEYVAEKCYNVKINEGTRDSKLLEDYEDNYYQKNDIHQINTLKSSTMLGGDMFIDIVPENGYRNQLASILESEVNYCLLSGNSVSEIRQAGEDFFWYGLGCVRTVVDPIGANKIWVNGKPRVERINPFRVFIDHACEQPNYSDIRHFFIKELIDIEELKQEFPDKAELISDAYEGSFADPDDTDGKCTVVTMQYKSYKDIEFVVMQDLDSGEEWEFTLAEVNKESDKLPEVDRLSISEPYKRRVPCWFQTMWISETATILQEPTYIGDRTNYSFMTGEQLNKNPYYVSMVSFLLDIQEMSTMLLTAMALLTVKNTTQIPIRHLDAFENREDVVANEGKIGQVYDIDTQWQLANPSIKPIEFITPQFDMQPAMTLVQMIENTVNQQMGTPDSMRGQAYASQSGAALQAIKSASTVYMQKEKAKILDFIADVGMNLANDIIYLNDHKHKIKSVNIAGEEQMVDVNTNIFNQLKPFSFYCNGITQGNDEQQKMVERQECMTLYNLGLLPPEYVLSKFDIPNPEAILQQARQSAGDQQLLEILHEVPALQDFVLNYKNQQINIGQTGSAGYDVKGMMSKNQSKESNADNSK